MAIQIDRRFENELVKEFADGECVFAQGDNGRELYIIQEGQVRIQKKTEQGSIDIATFKKGDFFGEVSLLQSVPRYAGAYAVGPCRLLVLKPAGFLVKIRRDPTFAFEMLQQMSARLIITNERLMALIKNKQISQTEVQNIITAIGEKM